MGSVVGSVVVYAPLVASPAPSAERRTHSVTANHSIPSMVLDPIYLRFEPSLCCTASSLFPCERRFLFLTGRSLSVLFTTSFVALYVCFLVFTAGRLLRATYHLLPATCYLLPATCCFRIVSRLATCYSLLFAGGHACLLLHRS